MRKNKKLLLGGLSVLTLVAAGSGAVSTFAWYQAANASITKATADTGTISTEASVLTANEFYIVPTVAVTPDNSKTKLALTDNGGETFAAVPNAGTNPQTYTLAAASAGGDSALFGTVSVTVKVYSTRTGTSPNWSYSNEYSSGDAALKNINGSYGFTLTAAGRARITQTADNKYSCGYTQAVTGSFDVAADGTFSVTLSATYCSIGGADTDGNATAGDVVNAVDTSVTASIGLTWN